MQGDFYQTPPRVSAIKKDGGPPLQARPPRQDRRTRTAPLCTSLATTFFGLELPEIDFRVTCSKGFYVRTYADEVGKALECGAHLSALRRTRSGNFDLTRSVTVEAMRELGPVELGAKLISLPEVSRLRGA